MCSISPTPASGLVAYRSVQIEAGLTEKGLQSRIPRRAARDRPLSERQKSAKTTRSKVRARVEHVFRQQQSLMGGKIVRTIGIARARFKIGMMNLGYNIRRLVQLERIAPALPGPLSFFGRNSASTISSVLWARKTGESGISWRNRSYDDKADDRL